MVAEKTWATAPSPKVLGLDDVLAWWLLHPPTPDARGRRCRPRRPRLRIWLRRDRGSIRGCTWVPLLSRCRECRTETPRHRLVPEAAVVDWDSYASRSLACARAGRPSRTRTHRGSRTGSSTSTRLRRARAGSAILAATAPRRRDVVEGRLGGPPPAPAGREWSRSAPAHQHMARGSSGRP